MPPKETATGNPRILMIDDDREYCGLIRDYLANFGYDLAATHSGVSGLEQALQEEWHAIILDVMLPGLNGFEVIKRLRRESEVPVLMLTAPGDEVDLIVGLEAGADDCLTKDSSTRQILARIHSITRRARAAASRAEELPAEEMIRIAELCIQPSARRVTLSNRPVSLTRGEFDVLVSLARAKGRVKTRDALLAEICERDWDVFDRTIDVHISSLRRKLEDPPSAPRFIRTVRSVGYMLMDPEAPV